jgi:hypothetical protein
MPLPRIHRFRPGNQIPEDRFQTNSPLDTRFRGLLLANRPAGTLVKNGAREVRGKEFIPGMRGGPPFPNP